jgi:hypothetical protein
MDSEVPMTRRMTIVFDDEELYTQLKVEAARAHRPAKDLVAEALCLLFEATASEQDAIQARARLRRSARRSSPVEDILQQLGIGKEPLGSPTR